MLGPFRISREVNISKFDNGILHYTMMEIIAASDYDSGWVVKQPPVQILPTTTQSIGVTGVTITATDRTHAQSLGDPKGELQCLTMYTADGGN